MKRIYFVRHGETEANAADVSSGSEFDTPLTAKGRDQAKITGLELKNKKIDLIVSSPMTRAMSTSQIIAKQIGYNPEKIVVSDFFTERDMGIYSKKPNAKFFADAVAETLHCSAETAAGMQSRVDSGLDWLKKLDAKNILVVSHGGISRILRLMHQDLPHSHMYKLERLNNAAIYEFEL